MCHHIQILRADKTDAEEIAKICYQVAEFHDTAAPQYFRAIPLDKQLADVKAVLNDENIVTFKAVLQDEIVGFLMLKIIRHDGQGLTYTESGSIINFGVDENHRRQGIGSALMTEAERYVLASGGKALDLNVFSFNQGAIYLYEKLGYDKIAIDMRKILK